MVKFFCRNCNFKYSPKTSKMTPPEKCGNCGTYDSVVIEPDASQIVRDS